MCDTKKVLIFGAAGRVGQALSAALLRLRLDVCLVDCIGQAQLASIAARTEIDMRLSGDAMSGRVGIHGGIDVLDEEQVTRILVEEKPDLVVNYAIPFTWDAAKQLPNYAKISRAGLGAFAAVQVLAPKIISQALAASGLDAKYVVGNLPDITIPIIYGLQKGGNVALPVAGAGNVGLIEAGLRHHLASDRGLDGDDLSVALVAHHIHWVAPREPGYRDDAPFLLKVVYQGEDITGELGDPRELMNRSIVACYEAGAGFSSSTALLAAKLILALLDEKGVVHSLHVPAPDGLPGGYPVSIENGVIEVDLPSEWQLSEAIAIMKRAHQRDGVDRIGEDGSIYFSSDSIAILREEIGFELPGIVTPGELEGVAREQIRVAQLAINESV